MKNADSVVIRVLLASLLTLSVVTTVHAQATGQQAAVEPDPRIIATIANPTGVDSDIARLDAAAVEAWGSPEDRLYIVSYPGRCDLPGKPYRMANSVREYLAEGRGIDRDRLAMPLVGPQQSTPLIEVWLGRRAPRLGFEPVPLSIDTHKAVLFDAYYVAFDCELGAEAGWENLDARLGQFAALLERNPTLTGYILMYSARPKRGYADPCPRFSPKQQAAERGFVVAQRAIASRRVILRNIGQASMKMVELWLVPAGKALPRRKPLTFQQVVGDCGEP